MDPETPDYPDEILSSIPEKYRRDTVEESLSAWAESSTNAERKITELAQEKKALEDNVAYFSEQYQQQQVAQQPAQQQVDPSLWDGMWDNDPSNATLQLISANIVPLQQQVAQLSTQLEQQKQAVTQTSFAQAKDIVASQYDDISEYEPRMREIIQSNPVVRAAVERATTADDAQQIYDAAYNLAKAEALREGKLPVTPGYDPAAAKQAAQTATGGNPRPDSPDEAKAAWEKIRNAGGGSYSDSR